MAIFNTPKKKKVEKKSEETAPVSSSVGMNPVRESAIFSRKGLSNKQTSDSVLSNRMNVHVSEHSFSSVLLRPRITEKASMLAEKNTYVFEVHPKANKKEVAAAIMNAYKVTPARVHIVNLPAKKVFSRGKKGMQSGLKKAIVYLKHGDKIEFV